MRDTYSYLEFHARLCALLDEVRRGRAARARLDRVSEVVEAAIASTGPEEDGVSECRVLLIS
jgi:hypothetical protein